MEGQDVRNTLKMVQFCFKCSRNCTVTILIRNYKLPSDNAFLYQLLKARAPVLEIATNY
jgi:hypothetical protein